MRRTALLAAAAAVAAVSIGAAPALAAKPVLSSSPTTFELKVVSGPDQVANWGEQVTFVVQQSVTSEPHVDLACTQNGKVVLGATTGFYDSYPWPWTQVMGLSSQMWTGGAADFTARLYYFDGRKTPTIKSLTFRAQA